MWCVLDAVVYTVIGGLTVMYWFMENSLPPSPGYNYEITGELRFKIVLSCDSAL